MGFEFLIHEFLSALHDLRTFLDSVSQTCYTQFCQKVQVHLDSFVQSSWLSWCEELISPKWAAAFSMTMELSPPPVTEASVHTPFDTGKVVASNSLTTSTGADNSLLAAFLAPSSVVAAPVVAVAAQGVPIPKFEFQARAANPVAIDPPSDSDTVAMEVDIPLATVVAQPPSVSVSEIIELSSNDEDDSDSDEVEFIGGTIPNLSPVHSKKGKGRGRKSIKASRMTTTSEDQYVRMPVHTFRDRSLPPEYLLAWQKPSIACLKDWPLPKMLDASVIAKASSHQGDYDEQMCDVNTAGSNYTAELELPLDTPIDEYETAIALTPCLCLAHTLPEMPEPDVESDTEGAPEVVTVKQEKDTARPSRCKLAIPPPLRGHFDRPPKCPRFDDSDLDDIMTQHFHAGTIVVLSIKVLKLHSLKGKAHAKGSSKNVAMKSELTRTLPATIEPSVASTQLEQMIELSQQLLMENCALRAHKSSYHRCAGLGLG
ncbi:uncharacterized protein LAESUDRAFT_764727 [Laetiporus sulphureus 93-53]|uniref:Uncharacterized protein n=1 Tax=Laetiporus sulphureus 93-53 TaxID=1314785 RepID=A0A165B5T6_9APHY|nr:uncharacterized protein LAESUDRAFT_764727 [Laetiporus sulphureus 93-53]KZT00304.1 hypothetical protein LAESUDRAFT_764727 [Laetiporus sulphureus 93-53]